MPSSSGHVPYAPNELGFDNIGNILYTSTGNTTVDFRSTLRCQYGLFLRKD